MSTPARPQPQLEPAGINCDQYLEFIPEKLELVNGHLSYGGQDQTGFHACVLTNMGLLAAIRGTGAYLWIESLDCHFRERLEAVKAQPEGAEAMINRCRVY